MGRIIWRMLAFLATATLLITALSGCGNSKRPKNAVKEMIKYLSAKYGDSFEYYAPFGGTPSSTTTQALFSCEGLPGAQIWAMCYMEEGEYKFRDDYLWHKYEPQTRALFEEIANAAFGCETTVDYSIGTKCYNEAFTGETTFEEFIATPHAYHFFIAVVSNERADLSKEGMEANIKRAIDARHAVTDGRIFFADSPDSFQRYFELSLDEKDKMLRAEFTMSGLSVYDSFEWTGI